jgi:hypothetical protein
MTLRFSSQNATGIMYGTASKEASYYHHLMPRMCLDAANKVVTVYPEGCVAFLELMAIHHNIPEYHQVASTLVLPRNPNYLKSPSMVGVGNIGVRIFADPPIDVRFGESMQGVLAVLGEPSGTVYRPSKTAPALMETVLNYTDRGMDIFFDPVQHTVNAISLHCNLPDSPDFGRCVL